MVFGLEAKLEFGHEGRVQLPKHVSFILHNGFPLTLEDELLVDQFQCVELAAPVVSGKIDKTEPARAQASHQFEVIQPRLALYVQLEDRLHENLPIGYGHCLER